MGCVSRWAGLAHGEPRVKPSVVAVLFDLDGTLVDSAPDLAGTANDMRVARGLPPLPYESLRRHAGTGARGMLGAAFGLAPGQPGFADLRTEFLHLYEQRMLRTSAPFDGAAALLRTLTARALPWGIVTNKALYLAKPMAHAMLSLAPAVLVAGDCTPHVKPHPEPLLEAARRLVVPPRACVYVGDDHRDIVAGRAAGMATLAATWGYLGPESDPRTWGADALLSHPDALLNWLDMA